MWVVWDAVAADPAAALEARLAETKDLRALRIAPGAPSLPDSAWEAAARGEIPTGVIGVDGVSAKKVWGVGLLDVDIATLWAGINDETQHPGYTAMGYSEIVSGTRCESGRHTLQYLPLSLVSDRWWVTILTSNAALLEKSGGAVRELTWRSSTDATEVTSAKGKEILNAAIPIGWSKGGWYLTAIDSVHTLAEYYTWSDPGGSVPAGMASMFATNGVRNQIEAMARFARDGKSRCPR
jgi:hypothetical protein